MSKFLSYAVVLLWMAVIFYFSNQQVDTSNKMSQDVAGILVQSVETVSNKSNFDLEFVNYIIRKNAHFFLFFMLGIFMMHALKKNKLFGQNVVLFAFGFCVLYALSDEFHQYFIQGRGAALMDVKIDSLGALFGLFTYTAWNKWFGYNRVPRREK